MGVYNVTGYETELAPEYRDKFKNVLSDRYNFAPRGFEQITENEFVRNTPFMRYMPVAIVYQQIHSDYDGKPLPGNKFMLSVYLYLYADGTGVGIADDYTAGKLRYFRFGCKHKYVGYDREYAEQHNLSYLSGRYVHNTVCTKCGDVRQYDSSD